MSTSPAAVPHISGSVSSSAWTLGEAIHLLQSNPHDRYLQFVALQLALRDGRMQDTASFLQKLSGQDSQGRRPVRTPSLLGLFSGTLAVQECLQLDAMASAGTANPEAGNKFQDERHVSDLSGATVRSHPWHEMLAGKTPELSRLSKMVPSDFSLSNAGQSIPFSTQLRQSAAGQIHLRFK